MGKVSDNAVRTVEVGRATVSATDITADSNHTAVVRFAGFSVRESAATAAAATVNFRHGTATGQILATVELPGDGSETQPFPTEFDVVDGVYVEVVAGTVTGVLYSREG